MFEKTDIIITTNNHKKELLKSFNNSLLNIKIYTLREFNKLFYYDYNPKTILYVLNKYQVISEIAEIYLNNLIYIEDKEYQSSKLNFLKELKKDLLEKNLLTINKLFKEYLKDKNIMILNLGETKEILKLKDELSSLSNVEIINNQEIKYKEHPINKLATIEDEVVFVANDICRLIKSGVDIKNIYLTNLSDEYYKLIRRIFPMFKIPFTINDKGSIYGTYLVNKFLESYSEDMNKTMEDLKELIANEEDEEIYNQILSIVNNYAFIDNYLEVLPLIKNDLKATKIRTKNIAESVHEANIDQVFSEEDYVYLLSFDQGVIPIIHRDELYLTDKEYQELNISLTVDKNNKEKKDTILALASIKNLIISFKELANGEIFNISNLNEELNYPVNEIKYQSHENSNLYNEIKLTSLKDEFNKYGTTSDELFSLASTYKDLPYNTFDHRFSGFPASSLKKFLNDKLGLSYTKVDNYYKCPFSYYLTYILDLNIYEDTFYTKLGTLYHAVLEKFNNYKGTYDELWEQELKTQEFNTKELFFLEKLHDELAFVIEVLKEQENYTELNNELHEEQVFTSLSGDMKITFTGYIDKIKYKEEEGRTIAAIIDYKTGNVDINLSTVPYGMGMQLPIYLYLAKNSKKLENVEVAGFYLQHVLNNEVGADQKLDYKDIKRKALMLQGYTNDDPAILSFLDKEYENSKLIKGMRINKDGSFSSYANTLSSEQITKLCDMAEKNIQIAANKISAAEFPIAPKVIDDYNYGCAYCKYRDICYHTPSDNNELEPIEDIFGGEE
jgi:ATP-dependent helicase/DNAse subunit B